jgi:ribonuclease HI
VRGHNGDPGNEHADMLANRGVEQALRGGRQAVR